jgi:phosphatidyl-myo-inositol dimannoside synthase|uniref:glycosyltransferase family 4 protein n=1 Tax=Candidatus Planktophila sp. TaxID=2175601 RepID=UPI00404ACABB
MVATTLFITNDFGPRAGGIETFVHGLIERLPKGSVIVYTSDQANAQKFDAEWLRNYGVEVIRDRSKILLPTPRVIKVCQKLISDKNLSNVAFGAAAPLGIMARAMRRAGAQKIVALTHGHEVWWAKVPPFTFAIRFMSRSIDAITYLGNYTRGEISKALSKADSNKLVQIAPGIDVDHFIPTDSSKLRAELGLADKSVIISVGRLVHRKGQDKLIAALPAIRTAVPSVHLVLVGVGPHQDYLEKLARKLKVSDSVTFIGRINYAELPKYICLGDIFAMPSRSRYFGLEVEGLGIVYLEASACGLPVVGGKSGGAPDAVLVGETGVVVDGTNSSEIAEACIDLLNNPELCALMGANGRSWIIENWRWEIWATRYAALLA